MKKNFLGLILISMFALLGGGCITTVGGEKTAGVPFRKDKIESRYVRPALLVYAAAKETLAMFGTLIGDDSIKQVLEAKVNQRSVWVKITEEEPNLTLVQTQVRTKSGGTDIDLAAEIDKQIALRLPR